MTEKAAAGWQPIETAPKHGRVDLWCVHPEYGAMRSTDMQWIEGVGWHKSMLPGDDDIFGPTPLNPGWRATAWMPLPEPPHE